MGVFWLVLYFIQKERRIRGAIEWVLDEYGKGFIFFDW